MATVLKDTKTKGRGVFASKPIEKGTIIFECPFLLFKKPVYKKHLIHTDLYHYLFWYPYDSSGKYNYDKGKYALILGNGSMLNHSDKCNATWKWSIKRQLHITKVIKDIAKGEEICFDYGEDKHLLIGE